MEKIVSFMQQTITVGDAFFYVIMGIFVIYIILSVVTWAVTKIKKNKYW